MFRLSKFGINFDSEENKNYSVVIFPTTFLYWASKAALYVSTLKGNS